MPLPPEITVTIEKINEDAKQGTQYLVKACRANQAEICSHTFYFRDDLLVDMEPQWMLEKAIPRHAGAVFKRGPAGAGRNAEVQEQLARYGQRLYGFLFLATAGNWKPSSNTTTPTASRRGSRWRCTVTPPRSGDCPGSTSTTGTTSWRCTGAFS